MNFTNFTDNKTANQDLTLFYNWLAYLYAKLDILDYFGLSGQVSIALQEESSAPIKNITFITNSEEIIDIVRNELLEKIKPKGIIFQKDNVYFQFENVIIDVYHTRSTLNFVQKNSFNCQDIIDIPNDLK
jgi:hypothetical protein